jgi:hypothetical protein
MGVHINIQTPWIVIWLIYQIYGKIGDVEAISFKMGVIADDLMLVTERLYIEMNGMNSEFYGRQH